MAEVGDAVGDGERRARGAILARVSERAWVRAARNGANVPIPRGSDVRKAPGLASIPGNHAAEVSDEVRLGEKTGFEPRPNGVVPDLARRASLCRIPGPVVPTSVPVTPEAIVHL